MGNTYPPTRTSPVGEDMANLSLWVDWENPGHLFDCLDTAKANAKALRDRRDNGKEFCQDTSEGESIATSGGESIADAYDAAYGQDYEADDDDNGVYEAGLPIGDVFWFAQPNGVGGKKKGKPHYEYVLVEGGRTLMFRRAKSKRTPNVRIDLGSIFLARCAGLESAWRTVLENIAQLGGHMERHLISRVDMYTDMAGINVGEFYDRFEKGWRVSRARSSGLYGMEDADAYGLYGNGRRKTGFTYGKGPLVRVYDKIFEMRNDPGKQMVFAERYGGTLPEELIRVEFEISREEIRDFNVIGGGRLDTVEDYLRFKKELWGYLTGEWFRLVDGPVDAKNRNQGKAREWEVWTRIQDAGNPEGKDLLPVRSVPRLVPINMSQLAKQSVSCAVKCGVLYGFPVTNVADYMELQEEFAKALGDAELRQITHRHEDERDMRYGQSWKAEGAT